MKNQKLIEYENLAKVNKPFFEEYTYKLKEVLNNGQYVLGENVSLFEKEFSSYLGCKYCVGVGSGLDALRLVLLSLNIKKGSEIIVPSNTYIATIMPIIEFGYKPILIDPDINSYNIDPNKIEQQITNNTKAIFITHLYGRPCDMDKIMVLVKRYKLKLVEDCAQAHGAEFKGKKVGTFGIGCFSFYPTKNLGGLGEGGLVSTNNHKLASKIKELRNYGSKIKYKNNSLGYNSRLDEIQSAFLRIKLRDLDKINSHKKQLAKVYDELLDNNFIKPLPDNNCVYHIYNIRYKNRTKLISYLKKNGVYTAIHYPIPPHKQKSIKKYIKGSYPISEDIHKTTLSLPISYFHTVEDIKYIIKILNSFRGK